MLIKSLQALVSLQLGHIQLQNVGDVPRHHSQLDRPLHGLPIFHVFDLLSGLLDKGFDMRLRKLLVIRRHILKAG